MTEAQIKHFMNLAMLEGRKALPKCLPNPPIGCVLVKDGKVVSTGYTNEPGNHHAEAMALANLKMDTEGITMFVTLEPCSFQGRTPSCAKAVTNTKIKKVFVSLIDPHPKNRGNGIKILEDAGISVHTGILNQEVMLDLADFLIKAYP